MYEKDPENKLILLFLAKALTKARHFEEALSKFQEGLQFLKHDNAEDQKVQNEYDKSMISLGKEMQSPTDEEARGDKGMVGRG